MSSSVDLLPTETPARRTAARLPAILALLLSAATFVVGLTYATTAASGADAYGYVSQADMWLEGRLTVDQTWMAAAEWPMARWTLTPLGYRPSDLVEQAWHIVPMYSPGLPLLMAGAKAIGGQELIFWVVPLSGAVLVLATFGIGWRLISAGGGLIAAWLLATSPTVLFMLMAPMSDVPVAAAWAASFYFLLDRRASRAAAAGAAAALAILIRPNLVFVAAIFGLVYVFRLVRADTPRRDTLLQGSLFSLGVVAGACGIAALNWILNGSPFVSGYGSLSEAFSSDHIWPNLTRYVRWTGETQSPLVFVGAVALLVPLRRLWPAARQRSALLLMAPVVATVFLFYLLYRVYDEWWFLRFVLTAWPFLMLGTGAVLAAAGRIGRPAGVLVTLATLALGIWQITVAADRSAFNLWMEERRYVTVGQAVGRLTDQQSVIFAMQHSGSIRYYAGRMTLRQDAFDGAWIDRVVAWYALRGIKSYMVLDDWEVPAAQERFSHLETGKRLLERPLFRYEGTSKVFFWQLNEPRDPFAPEEVIRDDYADTRSVEPAPFVPLRLLPEDARP